MIHLLSTDPAGVHHGTKAVIQPLRAGDVTQSAEQAAQQALLGDAGVVSVPAFDLALRPEYEGKLIVAIIPSFAERYLSTALFEGL